MQFLKIQRENDTIFQKMQILLQFCNENMEN